MHLEGFVIVLVTQHCQGVGITSEGLVLTSQDHADSRCKVGRPVSVDRNQIKRIKRLSSFTWIVWYRGAFCWRSAVFGMATGHVVCHLPQVTLTVQRVLRLRHCWLSTLTVRATQSLCNHSSHYRSFSAEAHADCQAAPDLSSLVATPGDAVDIVESKNRQLRTLLQTMHWPPMNSFVWKGTIYGLPYSPTARADRLAQAPLATLRYLAGFFDGDGCVWSNNKLCGCKLAISQSFKQAGVLLLFLDVFGGTVSRHSSGVGLRRPVLKWQVDGSKAVHAAGLMAPHSITKRKQLLLAARWPREPAERIRSEQELRALKQYDSAAAGLCSMEYFTGFFDADGYIRQKSGGTASGLSLHVKQKHVTVLECLQKGLLNCLNLDARVLSYKSFSLLYITRTAACKHALRAMLASGLLCKAEQATVAIDLTQHNALQVRAKLAEMVGNQGFHTRLDEAGLKRARAIEIARRQMVYLQRKGSFREADSKMREVDVLKHEHRLLNACHRNGQLRAYIAEITQMS